MAQSGFGAKLPIAYLLWRFVQAAANPDGEGADLKGIAKRISYGGSALIHAGFSFTAASLALGEDVDWGSSSEE